MLIGCEDLEDLPVELGRVREATKGSLELPRTCSWDPWEAVSNVTVFT